MTAFVLGVLAMAGVVLIPVTVTATAYTCEPVQQNPMHPCGPLRYGGDVHSHGMACPPLWAHTAIYVPKRGVMTCDDSGAHDTLYGLPHVDIRVGSHEEAVQWGIREVAIYRWIVPR